MGIFILPPNKKELVNRLKIRARDTSEEMKKRMKLVKSEISHFSEYDYVVINNNLDDCYEKIYNLIQAEIKNGSKDYDKDFIRNHIEKLTS